MFIGDNLVADGQAETGAFTYGFGGEKRVEQAIANLLGNARAVVVHVILMRSPSNNSVVISMALGLAFTSA